MDATETELRDLLDWIAAHDADAGNAATDLQMLLDACVDWLDADHILAALHDEFGEGEVGPIVVDPTRSATWLMLETLQTRIEIVRAAMLAHGAQLAGRRSSGMMDT